MFARVGWLVHPIADGTLAASPSKPASSAGWSSMGMAAPTADAESRRRGGSSPKCVGGAVGICTQKVGVHSRHRGCLYRDGNGKGLESSDPRGSFLMPFPALHTPSLTSAPGCPYSVYQPGQEPMSGSMSGENKRELKQVPLKCPSCPSPTSINL